MCLHAQYRPSNRRNDKIGELEPGNVEPLVASAEIDDPFGNLSPALECRAISQDVHPGGLESEIQLWTPFLRINEPAIVGIANLVAKALDKHSQTQHIRIDCLFSISSKMLILMDDARNDPIIQLSHESVQILVEGFAYSRIFQCFEAVSGSHNI